MNCFAARGVRSSSGLALIDPPNRESFTDGAPRQLTFAQADRAISTLAAGYAGSGCKPMPSWRSQLANTVENIITFLAVLRAGMIAVPVPLLWRRYDMIAGLRHIGARAIITSTRIGETAHAEIAMQVAAELFPIRLIGAFGDNRPDGVVPLDDIFTSRPCNARAARQSHWPHPAITPPTTLPPLRSMSRRQDLFRSPVVIWSCWPPVPRPTSKPARRKTAVSCRQFHRPPTPASR